MCILVLAWQKSENYPLVLASNRDEFLQRPTRAASFWPESPNVLGSQDLEAGGSWLLVTRAGRWATLTNFRDGLDTKVTKLSRGQLVLEAITRPLASLPHWLETEAQNFAGFNLLWGTSQEAWYFSNRGAAKSKRLKPGIHVLSNAGLATKWPKTERLRALTYAWLEQPDCHPSQLFATLADSQRAVDSELPETNIGLEAERLLSSIFIPAQPLGAQVYGTRTSTVVWSNAKGVWQLNERNFSFTSQPENEQQFTWHLEACSNS